MLLYAEAGLVQHAFSFLDVDALAGVAQVRRMRRCWCLAFVSLARIIIKILEVLFATYLLLLFNCFFFGLSGDAIALLLHDELVDTTLVDMQLVVATVLLSVDLRANQLLFNNLRRRTDQSTPHPYTRVIIHRLRVI